MYKIVNQWQIAFHETILDIKPPEKIKIRHEKYFKMPVYTKSGGYNNGVVLKQLEACGCTLTNGLIPSSLVVKTGKGTLLTRGKDYEFDAVWGTIGRIPSSNISEFSEVYIDYDYIPMRIDSIVLNSLSKIEILEGKNASYCPPLPALRKGDKRLMNILLTGKSSKLTPKDCYPILQNKILIPRQDPMQSFLPNTMNKLKSGGKLKILAWGDSVTDGLYIAPRFHWQQQFFTALKRIYPKHDIELMSLGWGGRCTKTFLDEPESSIYNFKEKVLNSGADLVISEFVNDAGLFPEIWAKCYTDIFNQFKQKKIEWIICTPHYVRHDWMNCSGKTASEMEDDPRPFVAFLRKFAAENKIALADPAKIYGQLYKTGIPYQTLMTNNINHPDQRGLKIYSDALLAIFKK